MESIRLLQGTVRCRRTVPSTISGPSAIPPPLPIAPIISLDDDDDNINTNVAPSLQYLGGLDDDDDEPFLFLMMMMGLGLTVNRLRSSRILTTKAGCSWRHGKRLET